MNTVVLNMKPITHLSDEQFYQLCIANRAYIQKFPLYLLNPKQIYRKSLYKRRHTKFPE
jgi:hypothetical protein